MTSFTRGMFAVAGTLAIAAGLTSATAGEPNQQKPISIQQQQQPVKPQPEVCILQGKPQPQECVPPVKPEPEVCICPVKPQIQIQIQNQKPVQKPVVQPQVPVKLKK